MRSRSGISVMFMTFIAVSILTLIFISYYLYLTQHNLSASEAQRIYAEAAQENIDAFYYPPGSEASSQGISQTLVIHNRGMGTVIKYLFYREASGWELRGPLNSGDIILRSGETNRTQLTQLLPDGAEILIVTERGSIFIAREGRFDISLNPASLKLLLPTEAKGSATLIIVSSNYEGKLSISVDEECTVKGESVLNLTRNGVRTVPIECAPPSTPGSYTYTIEVWEVRNETISYSKTTTLLIKVESPEAAAIPFSYFTLTIPNEYKVIYRRAGQDGYLKFTIRGYNDYYGVIRFSTYDPSNVIWYHPSVGFNPNPATLSPENPEATIEFRFNVKVGTEPGRYRIWIRGLEENPLPTRGATDYFDLVVTR